MELAIVPRILTSIGPFAITSAHLSAFLVTVVVLLIAFLCTRKLSLVPSRGQVVFEFITVWFWEQVVMVCAPRYRSYVLSVVVTLFLFILVANYFSLYPLLSSVVYNDGPLLTTPTAHLSLTLALGLFVVLSGHIIAFVKRPIGHLGNYIRIAPLFKVRSFSDFTQALISLFLGFMDIIGEFAKIISISCRLFGNLLSGDLMSLVIINLAFFTQFLVPVPFYVLGLFSALVQAVVFSLLSVQFLSSVLSSIPEKSRAQTVRT
jgi:F-type H+-transporting ATPase subunit a